jgi:uncharacterized protein (UPF0333 family)
MMINNQKGVALVLTLMVIVVLLIVGSSFILRAVNEWKTALREKRIAQAFSITEGGAAAAVDKLDDLINTYMLNTINQTNPQTVGYKAQQFVVAKDGLGFLTLYVKNGGTALLTRTGNQATYSQSVTSLGSGSYSFDIIITQKSDPVTVATDVWDFPFYYQARAQGQ